MARNRANVGDYKTETTKLTSVPDTEQLESSSGIDELAHIEVPVLDKALSKDDQKTLDHKLEEKE